MKPIEELTGLTMFDIPLDELKEEYQLRNAVRKEIEERMDASTVIEKIGIKQEWEEIASEMGEISREMDRLTLVPAPPSFPAGCDMNAPLFGLQEFLYGVEYGRALAAYDIQKKSHIINPLSAQYVCICAQKLWNAEPNMTIGKVAEKIAAYLPINGVIVPGKRQIIKWIKDAGENNVIKIPPGASRRGRPKKI